MKLKLPVIGAAHRTTLDFSGCKKIVMQSDASQISGFFLMFVVLNYPGFSQAEIYQCQAGQEITFTDLPCPAAKSQKLSIKPANISESNLKQARELSREESKKLKSLETIRQKQALHDEKIAQKNAVLYEKQRQRCANFRLKIEWAEQDLKSSNLRSEQKAKIRLQRMHQQASIYCKNS